ncbi:crossover junction endodeoxyribonuclease RuvC [Desulfosoma caldarium]|uniref:Crossover junction endodeoxyribonuclease RuvC n=1 Tax=Desulfosoma caldarium TaxID=610254 RepID=A0A3N1US51_9BACT|nr:crossover junction endodeoxyribonuclease RuvC [Desulfosoma caldarium]ROQ90681.1 Holliday junction endonuclease RuvC [Desulfosoma caldarium]
MRVLGIDPGSRHTGYGVVENVGDRLVPVLFGSLSLPASMELPTRLGSIFTGIRRIIEQASPTEMAVEAVFVSRNARSALILGHARGAAMAAGIHGGLQVFEYSALEIKQAVVGYGKAEKSQVARMVGLLLGLHDLQDPHAADALAAAVCHIHARSFPTLYSPAQRP